MPPVPCRLLSGTPPYAATAAATVATEAKKNISRSESKENVLSPLNIEPFLLLPNNSSFSNDGKIKIICLIIFASLFNSIGTIIRNEDFLNPCQKKKIMVDLISESEVFK